MKRNVNGVDVEMSAAEEKEFLDQQAKDVIAFAPKPQAQKLSNGALADVLVAKGILQAADVLSPVVAVSAGVPADL